MNETVLSETKSPKGEKIFYFVRHGISEMNEKLEEIGWANPAFVDFDMWDARLSSKGVHHAIECHHNFALSAKNGNSVIDWESVEIVLSSPLSRALETAKYLFNHHHNLLGDNVPKVVHPLLRERLFMSSDVGRLKSEIAVEFPGWNMDHLADNEPWWYVHDELRGDGDDKIPNPYIEWRPPGVYSCKGEPTAEFKTRLIELKAWLLSRPETTLLIVAHWGIIRGLTGVDAKNCGVVKVAESQLLGDPFVDE